jgi:glycosyltransferase involved in cell wall biosynthesis
MLRPTATDGDAVSVREALHLGVPVVASDVVERPTGARVFALDDPKALTARILEALALPERARHWPQPDPFPRLLELYRKVGGSAVAGFPSM